MGAKLMPVPDVPWVRYVGLLSEADRLRALEAATIVVVPSPFESLSLLALEGMAVGNPVLCNAHADVLVDHCTRSNAGLFYSNREEFVECIHLLLADRQYSRADGPQRQTVRCRELFLERHHGEIRRLDGVAAQGMNATLLRKAVFAAIFLAAFGIYVMRASNERRLARAARDRRRPRLRRNRIQRVARPRLRVRMERRRLAEAIRGDSAVSVAADVGRPSSIQRRTAPGDAAAALCGLCDHRQKFHRVARRQLRGYGRRRDDGRDHVRAVCWIAGRGDHGGHPSPEPRADALFRHVHDRAAGVADVGSAGMDVDEERALWVDDAPRRHVWHRDGRPACCAHDLYSHDADSADSAGQGPLIRLECSRGKQKPSVSPSRSSSSVRGGFATSSCSTRSCRWARRAASICRWGLDHARCEVRASGRRIPETAGPKSPHSNSTSSRRK